MKMEAQDTMALIVDYQQSLMKVMLQTEQMAKHSAILIEGLKLLDIPMIITQQYTKGLGMSSPFVYEAAGTDQYLDKTTFGCMGDQEIARQVKALDRKNVIVCGIEAHICVLQTCIGLAEQGYRPILVVDCISSRRESDLKTAVTRAVQEGVTITTYESILFELMQKAGGDTFKKISKLIK